MSWSVQTLRLTVFGDRPVSGGDGDWRAFTGRNEADARAPLPPNGRTLSGPFSSGQLTMNFSGSRADAILSLTQQPPGPSTAAPVLPVLGSWSALVPSFADGGRSWLASLSLGVVRIAFGAVLLYPTKNRVETNVKLSSLLKSLNIDTNRARDLAFKVNWPTKSADGLLINRITSFTQIVIVNKIIQIVGDQFLDGGNVSFDAAQLELDHNSDQDKATPFKPDQLVSIYEELLALARQNVEQGEVL